jgi:hypothetical protein
MELKIALPNKIAVCLFANDDKTIEHQLTCLGPLNSFFEIEYWFRKDRNPDMYHTFSQMINEAIDDTDSEFMVFINPKSEILIDDIKFIISGLCSGYAAVYTTSFGVHGATKELFRRIGLFDERFLHSECEDDDMLMRISVANKAIFYKITAENYKKIESYRDPLRGVSGTIFENKWYKDKDGIYYLNPEYKDVKKISKRHRKNKNFIYDSWFDKSKSVVLMRDDKSNKFFKMSSELNNLNTEKIVLNPLLFNIIVSENKTVKTEFICDNNILIHVHFVEAFPSRKIIIGETILANNWTQRSFAALENNFIEVRLYHDGNIIYHNTLDLTKNDEIKLIFNLPIKIRG